MITIERTPDTVRISGHSGLAPPGQDIICSSVSTLVQTLQTGIEQLTDDDVSGLIQPGYAVIRVRNPSERTLLLIDSFFIGITGVADAYPDYVQIINQDACCGVVGHAVGSEQEAI